MSQKRNSQNAEFVEFIRKGDLEGVKRILLEQGNDLLLKKKFGEFKETALHLAVKHGHESIVKHLLEIGADIHATDHHLRTVLHTVFETGDINIITLILQCQGVKVNATEEYGNTPVKLAAEKGNIRAVKLLMEKGADITIADKVGCLYSLSLGISTEFHQTPDFEFSRTPVGDLGWNSPELWRSGKEFLQTQISGL
ncbi:hypothetical protein OS493_027163 [Desmophyllum pertusum]|uniref:Ankyrin repeat protein n=1 Tax=Desmophyllum pertusum TaxID=174260 RepID=A0A9W9ZYA8_9CNID|nr:hypothetical protein OS493_027163 [Desmophyllum pertusum]